MSYYSNYEGYQPSFYESDNDYEPTLPQESYAPPEMTNLERLLKDAIEQTERHSREWDEIFDWNLESYQEKPYDTFSNAIEHLDDVEAIEHNDDYSNDYVPRSFKIVYEDSEDEEDEYYAYDNYPQPTTQAVLQESNSFEHEPMENSAESECSNSDFVESMEEEVQESVIILDLEAEKSAATTSSLEEEEPNVSYQGSNVVDEQDDVVKELQEVLGMSDQKLDELVESGVGDDQILEAEFVKLYQANEEQAQADIFGGDDSTIAESKSGLVSNCLPCNYECLLLIEPKPPNEFLKELVFRGGMVKSNIGHGQMNELIELDNFVSLNRTNDCVFISYFEEPPDCFSRFKNHLYLRVSLTSPCEGLKVNTRFTSLSLRMYCKNDKPKENILENEYDWKGRGKKVTSSHLKIIVWELEPD